MFDFLSIPLTRNELCEAIRIGREFRGWTGCRVGVETQADRILSSVCAVPMTRQEAEKRMISLQVVESTLTDAGFAGHHFEIPYIATREGRVELFNEDMARLRAAGLVEPWPRDTIERSPWAGYLPGGSGQYVSEAQIEHYR